LLGTTLAWSPNVVAQSAIQFEMPLMVNNALSGNISATITEVNRGGETSTMVTIPKQRFRTLVEKFANDEQIETWLGDISTPETSSSGSDVTIKLSAVHDNDLASQVSSQSNLEISLYQLRQRGLKINFDSAELKIDSSIPRLGTQTLSLRGRRQPAPSDGYSQARISSGLNISISNEFNHRNSGLIERGFGDTNANINGFTSLGGFGGWSLFYQGNYRENDDKEFARGDTTLIHDDYKNGVRYSIGDVAPNPINQQSSPDLLGFSIERNYEQINPLRNLRPSGRNSFTLDRPSRVSFEVNGRIVDTRQLEPGNYSAEDFPLAIGANNIRVFVDDGSSNIEVANFSAFSNLDLLAQGISNFGVNVGVLRDTTSIRSRRYTNDLVALASYERGISQNLTVGIQAEISQTNALIGSSAIYGTRHGIYWRARADIQIDHQSSNFGGVNNFGETNERSAIFASFGVSKGGYNLSINATSADNNGIVTDTFSTALSKSYQYFDLSLDYRYSKTDGIDSSDSYSLNISKSFGRSTIRGQYQSANDQYRATWTGPSSFEAGQGSLNNVVLIQNEDFNQARLNSSYIGSRFVLDADHSETRTQASDGIASSTTNLRAATSLGYADGKFALGRPFNNGFLIVSPHENLRGKRVSVRRSNADGDLITETKHLSTTLVPLNGSYREQRYHLDVEDLPIGYDIGASEVDLFPGFLAGYNYKLGSDASSTVIGKVEWPNKTPPSLIGGKIVSNDTGEITTIFTNKTGRFVAERMSTGAYTIIFNDGYDDFSAPLTIEQRDEPGLIRLDKLSLIKVEQ